MQRPNWIEVPRNDVMPQYAAPYSASINRKGEIAISRRTWENLGSPTAFQLLFDPDNGYIGLKPSTRSTPNAYPAGPHGASGARIIRAHRLLREYRLTIEQTLSFQDPDTDPDGVLVLKIRTAKPSVRAASQWKRR